MMLGYTNLVTTPEEIDQEVGRLRAIGCDQIVVDSEFGPESARRVFRGLVDSLGSGDAIAVCGLDRIASSVEEILALLLALFRKGVALRVLEDNLVIDAGEAQAVAPLLDALLRVPRQPPRLRGAGRTIRAPTSRRTGRPRVLLPQDATRVEALLRQSGANVAAVAKELGVSAATLYRFLRDRHREAKETGA